MARKTKKEVLQARQDESAPFLFDGDALPHRPDLVRAVQERRYEVTGARLLDDDGKVMRLVDLLLRQPAIGLRKIARELGCSRDTVRAARDTLVSQGKLAPYRERVVKIYEEIIEAGAASFLEDIENGRVPVGSKPLAVGIFADKRALAVGEPTTISVGATAQLRPEALSVEALNSWVKTIPVESQSIGSARKQTQIEEQKTIDAASDAGSGGEAGQDGGLDRGPERRDLVGGGGGEAGSGVGC